MSAPEPSTSRRLGVLMLLGGWLLVTWVLWQVFDGVLDRQENPNAQISTASKEEELMLKRNRAGHYLTPGIINGEEVRFMLDTGATVVSVPAHLASRLALRGGASSRAITANGTVTVKSTVIRQLQIGPFHFENVPGHLNPGMQDNTILLGMSVLKHMEFVQRGNTLTLRAAPAKR